jgi:hypothetical protein
MKYFPEKVCLAAGLASPTCCQVYGKGDILLFSQQSAKNQPADHKK